MQKPAVQNPESEAIEYDSMSEFVVRYVALPVVFVVVAVLLATLSQGG